MTADQGISDAVHRAGKAMAFHLDEIAKLFKADVKLTLLVRHPGKPERNAYLSDEADIEPVVEALRELFTNPDKVTHV